MQTRPVIVLGGGPMGLAVAYELCKQGIKPIILESQNRLGGMSASFVFEGHCIERFYHFHSLTDKEFFKIAKELGIKDKIRKSRTSMGYYYHGKLYPWGTLFSLLSFPYLNFLEKLRYGFHAFLSSKRRVGFSLESVSAVSWLKSWLGENVYQKLWHPILYYKFHRFTPQVSAAWLQSRIFRIGNSRKGLNQEVLMYLEGGTETLIGSFASYIQKRGGEIHLDSPAISVKTLDNGLHEIKTPNGSFVASQVVSTIPTPLLPDLFRDVDETLKQKWRSIANIAVVCAIVFTKKPITENFWVNINDERFDIPGIVEYTNLNPLTKGNGHITYIPFYMPSDAEDFQKDDAFFIEKTKQHLQKINPELQSKDFQNIVIHRLMHAQPISTKNFRRKLPPIELPIEGLWAADTSYYYPWDRGINESVELGRSIAKRVAKKMKHNSA